LEAIGASLIVEMRKTVFEANERRVGPLLVREPLGKRGRRGGSDPSDRIDRIRGQMTDQGTDEGAGTESWGLDFGV
jgi:hypothetical protein